MEKQYKTGLVIGRFQPFHNGHLYLLKEALKICDKIIIGIGSSNVVNDDNPWSAEKRRQVIEKVISEENLADKVIKVVEIPDDPDDEVWYENVANIVGKFDIWLGNNDWNDEIFTAHGVPVLKVDFWQRYLHEGTKIRKLIKEKKSWQSRVPSYIISLL